MDQELDQLTSQDTLEITPLAKPTKKCDSRDDIDFKLPSNIRCERMIRLAFSVILLVAGICIIYIKIDASPYHNIAYSLALVEIIWLLQFVGIVISFEHMHLIHVSRHILPGTKYLAVVSQLKEYPDISITSISALSALRGSNTFGILQQSMNIQFGMIFSAVSIKVSEIANSVTGDTDYNNRIAISLLLLLIASYGGGFVAIWELDRNLLSTSLHYVGALLAFLLSPLAFAIHQSFTDLSIGLMTCTYFWVAFYGIVSTFGANTYDTPVKIHAFSLCCIFSELIVVVLALVSGILLVFCLEGDVKL